MFSWGFPAQFVPYPLSACWCNPRVICPVPVLKREELNWCWCWVVSYVWACLCSGRVLLGLYAFICSVLDLKQDSLQFSAVLLQIFCDMWPVLGTFSIAQEAQELWFLWRFSGTAWCLTTCSSLSHSRLILLFSLGPSCYLTSPSPVYVRNVSVPMLSQHLLFLPLLCPCCCVGQQCWLQEQYVCAWCPVDISFKKLVQPTLMQLALMSPSYGTLTSLLWAGAASCSPRHTVCCILSGFSSWVQALFLKGLLEPWESLANFSPVFPLNKGKNGGVCYGNRVGTFISSVLM